MKINWGLVIAAVFVFIFWVTVVNVAYKKMHKTDQQQTTEHTESITWEEEITTEPVICKINGITATIYLFIPEVVTQKEEYKKEFCEALKITANQ